MQADSPQTITNAGSPPADDIQIDLTGFLSSHFVLVIVMTATAGLLRYLVFRGIDFPLQDGAWAYKMAEAVATGNYRIPQTALFDGRAFESFFPPLGVMLAVFIDRQTGGTLFDLFQTLPGQLSIVTVPLVYILSLRLTGAKWLSFTTALVFGFMPVTTNWMVVGSGIVRTPGYIFALLAIHQGYALLVWRNENHLLTTAILAAFAFLSDPESGYFVLYTLILMTLVLGRNRYSVINLVFVLTLLVMLGGIWLVPAMVVYGVEPYLSAAATVFRPSQILSPLLNTATAFTGEPFIPVIALLGYLGFCLLIAKRRFFLPLWFIIIMILHTRSASAFMAIPLAFMAGAALHQLVIPLLLRSSQISYEGGLPLLRFSERAQLRQLNQHFYLLPVWVFGIALAGYIVFGAYRGTQIVRERVIDEVELAAFEFITSDESRIPDDARFLVFTSETDWRADTTATWFPALTGRESVLLVPESAWYNDFGETLTLYNGIDDCTAQPLTCLIALDRGAATARGIAVTPAITQSDLVRLRVLDDPTSLVIVNELLPEVFEYLYISPGVSGALLEYLVQTDGEVYTSIRAEGNARIYQLSSLEITEQDAEEIEQEADAPPPAEAEAPPTVTEAPSGN